MLYVSISGEGRVLLGNLNLNSYFRVIADREVDLSTLEAELLIDLIAGDKVIVKIV